MKRIAVLVLCVFLMLGAAWAVTSQRGYSQQPGKNAAIYFHWIPTSDWNDANYLLLEGFSGDIRAMVVDVNASTGVNDVSVSIMIDPEEYQQAQIERYITLKTLTFDYNDSNSFYYPLTLSADDPNCWFDGIPAIGDLYLQISDANDDIDSLKIWLFTTHSF